MSGDPAALQRLRRIVVALGMAAILAVVVFIATGWSPMRFVISALAFLFAVAAMIYRADRRPAQKHTMK